MPPRSGKAVVGLYLSGVGLESLLDDLTGIGFHNEDVCAILPPTHSAARALRSSKLDPRHEGNSEVEAATEWFAQCGAVIIPEVGAFIAGRELVSVLFGSTTGEMVCNNAFHQLGLPPAQVERYRGWAHSGGVIVYVCCETEDRVCHAIEVLEEAGAEEVARLDVQDSQSKLTTVPLLKAS